MIRVLICEDMVEIENYMAASISTAPEIDVVGMAKSGAEAVILAEKLKPDVILMDIEMESETAGIIATEKIVKKNPSIKVIMLTVHNDDDLIISAYHAGAVDFIIKMSSANEIIDRIKTVYNMEWFVGPLITKKVMSEYNKLKFNQESIRFFIKGFSNLTRTEREILKLLYLGYNKPQISEMRTIEFSTTVSHVKHIKKKLNFRTTKELVNFLRKIKIFEEFDI